MINHDQIDEWVHEAEERPSSAPLIIQYIASRLRDLTSRNEELLAENIELRTGRKVEDYESRIANLEYQLDLLKRQLGDTSLSIPNPAVTTVSVLVYNIKGKALRMELPVEALTSGSELAKIAEPLKGGPPRLLVTSPMEELLFVFDSGRAEAVPVGEIPALSVDQMDWRQGYLVEPHGGEELAFVLPIARMTLFDYCIQTSRRGCAKKMMKTSFESHVSKSFVGAGVKSKPDKTCDLVLTGRDDVLALSSREGFLWTFDVSQLPYTIEEVLKLSATDYITSSFVVGSKPSLLIITQNGKVINREAGWLEKANSFKSRGQPIFSQARREAGIRAAGAAVVDEKDWCAVLTSHGQLTVYAAADLIASGTLFPDASSDAAPEVLEFTAFAPPSASKA